jgi:hypothetical protein
MMSNENVLRQCECCKRLTPTVDLNLVRDESKRWVWACPSCVDDNERPRPTIEDRFQDRLVRPIRSRLTKPR